MKLEKKIKHAILKSKNVFVVGHKNLDLDAIAACIGITSICDHFDRQSYIIIDDEVHELGVEKILCEYQQKSSIIKSTDIPKYHHKNSLLVIVDTNKIQLLQNEKIVNYFDQIIVLDHHQATDQSINREISKIDEDASSTCEIITNIIDKLNIPLNKQSATIVLSGIVLDTNNFIVRTTADTYKAAYLLTKQGADPKKVQYYLKQDINDYIMRQKAITEVTVINKKFAFTGAPENIQYKREDLAKIADTLLQFNNIEASFVLGNRVDGGIGLSARSIGNVNVGKVVECLGGGGDNHEAAAQVKNISMKEATKLLLEEIEKEDI